MAILLWFFLMTLKENNAYLSTKYQCQVLAILNTLKANNAYF